MRQSDIFRENAEKCAQLAEAAASEPGFLRYKRMEAAWLALADEQDWLDGERSINFHSAEINESNAIGD
jgi:hypothetical protein